ncbi:hypothetical protein BG006_002587 [Podila minutissima]|uniref:Heterokaryon incompatibility domain-containing protein n=1 Tax=Podila minutissima TaxID=64525 RepID=A0A9P5VGK1_9FUNG|nr:hypothetical protein BG006_002587 [Podila minutissima]
MCALSAEDMDRAISELATKVLECVDAGIQTGVTEQCVTVMSNVRGIPCEGGACECIHCYKEFPWREGLVARMNRSCGAFAWRPSHGLVVGPGQTNSLIECTWKSVSIMVDEWGRNAGRKLQIDDYRNDNQSEGRKSFSPVMAAGPPHTVGFEVLAIGAEGMLNGAGCKATGKYREKHVCLWDNDQKEEDYWDERNIIATIVAKGWKGDLWLDWTDIPQDPLDRQDPKGAEKESYKIRKLNTQALLYAEADHVYVFVPQADFDSINKAIRLSETATTCDDFIEVIHHLHGVKWFQSTWTLQEMFMSYECMEVVAGGGKTIPCGGNTIPCGWLGKLKDRLAVLVDRYGAHLEVDDDSVYCILEAILGKWLQRP